MPRSHPISIPKYPVTTINPVLIPIKSISHHHLHHHQQPHIGHHPHSSISGIHDLKARFGHSPHSHHPLGVGGERGIITVKKIGQVDSHHGHHHHKSHQVSARITPLGHHSPHHHHGKSLTSSSLSQHHQLHRHKSDHHNHRDLLTGKIHHHHHHTGKTYVTSTTALLPPSLPLVDDHGRIPHHGHLILHHKLKKK